MSEYINGTCSANEDVNAVNEAVENAVKKRLADLEGRLYVMAEESVNRCEFSEADKKILKDTIQEAFAFGQASKIVNEEGKELFANIENHFNNALSSERQKLDLMLLHYNSVTGNLLNVAQNLFLMVRLQEEKSNSLLGLTSLMGLGSSKTPTFECALKP